MLRKVVALLMFLGSCRVYAGDYSLMLNDFYTGDFLKLDEMYLETRKYDTFRNPYIPNEKHWNFISEFHNNMSFYKKIYWNTNLHMSMDEAQIRYVGLEYTMGAKVLPWMHIIKYHHSTHVLEVEKGNKAFPVEDSYGFRVYFKQ